MAFDPTVGGNSYISIDEADAYFEFSLHNKAVWADVEDKESSLVTASNILDWYTLWKGTKVDVHQPLHWPAEDAYYVNGDVIPITIIPDAVKVAVCELAVTNVTTNRLAENSLAGIDSIKAGPLSLVATGAGTESTVSPKIPSQVSHIVKDLVSSGGNTTRLYRG